MEHKADAMLIWRVPEEDEVDKQYLPPVGSLDLDLGHLPKDKQQKVITVVDKEIIADFSVFYKDFNRICEVEGKGYIALVFNRFLWH
ncbi:hypothetical protein AMECASPLE_026546 [Ameca splendens]|uniref:Uncharacterized protein n=1 Tax=Ameca splendens TaxID=208324 RepID=A0ABV0XHY8_9TELE